MREKQGEARLSTSVSIHTDSPGLVMLLRDEIVTGDSTHALTALNTATRQATKRSKAVADRRLALTGTNAALVPDPVPPPRHPEEEREPGPPRAVQTCNQRPPEKPAIGSVKPTILKHQLQEFAYGILGHLIAHAANTPFRQDGRVICRFGLWLGYPMAHGVPPGGCSDRFLHRIEYVAMLVCAHDESSKGYNIRLTCI